MRFGLPRQNENSILVEPCRRKAISHGDSRKDLLETPFALSSQSPCQILNESLSKLDALYISRFSEIAKEKSRSWNDFSIETTRSVESSMAFIDNDIEQEIQKSQLKVHKIIETRIRLREEERKRVLALEEEKKRREQEESERQRRAKEEEQKRLEEQRKLAEEKKKLAEEQKILAEQQRLEEQKRLSEEQRLKKEKEEKDKIEKKKAELLKLKAEKEAAAKKVSAFGSKIEVEKSLLKYLQDIKDIKDNVVAELDKDKELKKNVGMIKRKVNVKLGQLSNSHRQLESVTKDVLNLIQPLTSHPVAYKWLLNFVSKAIVSQAETEVTVKPAAALPLGRLAYNLLRHLDGLEYYLSARFVKKCCLIIGYTGSIDTEEGRSRMGWRRSNGKWETEVKYEERMGGILSVWAVIGWVNQSSDFILFNMQAEWRFLARLLNTTSDLLADVHFVAACGWWEAAAEKFYATYGQQAKKVLSLAVGQWAAKGVEKGSPGATRLQVLGDDLFSRNKFNGLKEMEN